MAYTTIDDPTIFFNTILWTGDGNSSRSITGVGFAPDMVWLKGRTTTYDHRLVDKLRTGTYPKLLYPNLTTAESEDVNNIGAIGSDGFTVGSGNAVNQSGQTYCAWNWKAGGTASSNSDGSITSSVSANTTAGFSIVSYTGTGSNATIGHGLGSIPAWIFTKNRDATQPWRVYHKAVDASAPEDYGLILNDTSARDNDATAWNDTAPTSSVFSVGSSANTNNSSDDFIAYCFAEKQGFSKFGTYTGNGNAYGPYIHTGFKPAFFIYRNVETTSEEWKILDDKRDTFNRGSQRNLVANSNVAESDDTNSIGEFLSNGVKIRSSHNNINKSGSRYIFIAFAASSYVNGNGVPTNAR
jgi:hypothetical protein